MVLKPVVIPKEKRDDFYQCKYDHFKKMTVWVIIMACILEMLFYVSDCSEVLGISVETIKTRFILFIPLIAYIVAFRFISSYKIMSVFSYIMIHACMLSILWTSYYIGNTANLRESFLMMHFLFIVVGISAPKAMHCFFHILMIAEFIIAFGLSGFGEIYGFISLAGSGLVAVCVFQFIFENSYAEQYVTAKKLEDISLHDQLTGAFNRSKLNMLCMAESDELIFKNAGFILTEINDFKKLNENFGHDVGDRVLKEFYEIIKVCTRGDDVCIRIGGEQFLIIVPNQGLARTKEIGQRIRNKISNKNNFTCAFEVSVGVAIYRGGDYHVTISLADKALKFALENEVDMVVAYEDM